MEPGMDLMVMLDLDGTLLDTRMLYFIGVPVIVEKYLGMRVGKEDFMDLWGLDIRICFERFIATAGRPAALVDEMYAGFEDWYIANHSAYATPYADVGPGLARLTMAGIRMGVVTTRTQRRAELVYDFPWGRWMNFVVGGDKVSRRKPCPDSLDHAIEKFGEGRQRYIYLGDNKSDVEAAKSSHYSIVSAGALWGAEQPEKLRASEPDFLFPTFESFSRWVLGNSGACDASPAV